MTKILVIPSSECNTLLDKLCVIGKEELEWELFCVAPKYYLKYYKNFIHSENQLYDLPDLLQEEDWEKDCKQKEEIKSIIAASEKKIGVPINRIVLSCEKDIGRAYSKYNYNIPENGISRISIKNNDFFEILLLRAFKFVLDTLRATKPGLCIGAPPAGILRLAFYYLTHYFDIPYAFTMFSMILPNRHYWSKGWGGFNDRVHDAFKSLKERQISPTSDSLQYIHAFQDRPEPMPIYLSLWGDDKKTGSFLAINKSIFQRSVHRVVPFLKGIKVSNPKPFWQFFLDVYRIAFLKIRQRKLYRRFSGDELETIKYFYYPCHQEPEFVLSLRAPNWFDQLATIKKLSFNLPSGYKLLVREHRYNAGRKRTAYLKEIMSYPGVVLIDGYDDQYKYIKNADLVITVNGTSGLEGLMLGKKVLTLDKTNYDAIVKTAFYEHYVDLGGAIFDALKEENIVDIQDLALFVDAERMTTFSDEDTTVDEVHYILEMMNVLQRDKVPEKLFS